MSFSILVLLALLLGCASAGPSAKAGRPEPAPEAYLTAEGLGSTEGEARNQARAELSRIFDSRVQSDAHDRITAVVESSEAATTESTRQEIASRVRVISEARLEGVEVGEAWQEGGVYHALAKLDRRKAGDKWLRELEDMDARTEALLGTVGSLGGRLLKYRALKAAAGLWLGREVVISRLRVVGFYQGGPRGYDMAEVFRRTAEIKAAMPVHIEISGDQGARLRAAVSETLGRAGYVMTEDASLASVRITGAASVQPVEMENPRLKYARATASFAIADQEAGLAAGEVVLKQRGAHITYAEAAERALKKLSESAPEKLIRLMESASSEQ